MDSEDAGGDGLCALDVPRHTGSLAWPDALKHGYKQGDKMSAIPSC